MILALVVWVGGIIFFAFVMAPAVFAVLPTHQMAGTVIQRTLPQLHWLGIVAGIVFLLAAQFAGRWQRRTAASVLILLMLALTLVSQYAVSPRMMRLQAQMPTIDAVSATDSRRVAFNHLHRCSTGLEGGVLILGLAVVYLTSRENLEDRFF
jgi:uncharacterized membrane protein